MMKRLKQDYEPSDVTQIHTPTVVQGGGGGGRNLDGTPPRRFLYVAVF